MVVGNLEKQAIVTHHVAAAPKFEFESFSSLRLQRFTALTLTFGNNCQALKKTRYSGPIEGSEINIAMIKLIWVVQQQSFGPDIKLLNDFKELPINGAGIGTVGAPSLRFSEPSPTWRGFG